MINRFRDHAANERTYLAWIRTSIAVMAFGFLVEKFDIFISYIGHALGTVASVKYFIPVKYIGLALMLVGVAIIFGATIRFFHYDKAIDADSPQLYKAKWPNVTLASIMIVFAVFLFFYLIVQVVRP